MAKPPIGAPYAPQEYEDADVLAFKALKAGKPNDVQCRRVLNWIHRTCGTDDLEWRPDDERHSSFASGKRFVGLQVKKLTDLPNELLLERTDVRRTAPRSPRIARPLRK